MRENCFRRQRPRVRPWPFRFFEPLPCRACRVPCPLHSHDRNLDCDRRSSGWDRDRDRDLECFCEPLDGKYNLSMAPTTSTRCFRASSRSSRSPATSVSIWRRSLVHSSVTGIIRCNFLALKCNLSKAEIISETTLRLNFPSQIWRLPIPCLAWTYFSVNLSSVSCDACEILAMARSQSLSVSPTEPPSHGLALSTDLDSLDWESETTGNPPPTEFLPEIPPASTKDDKKQATSSYDNRRLPHDAMKLAPSGVARTPGMCAMGERKRKAVRCRWELIPAKPPSRMAVMLPLDGFKMQSHCRQRVPWFVTHTMCLPSGLRISSWFHSGAS